MSNTKIIIIGMIIATGIPRLSPFLFKTKGNMPDWVNRFLNFVPFAAIGALTIPGAFTATPEVPMASVVGFIAAAIASWYKGGIILPIITSIVATFLVLYI
ncbi:AzlD domain-containing protein [Gottschalkia purinilytica]|nr:AzlD domain-containing protein [Gottschalkia purinilytica]